MHVNLKVNTSEDYFSQSKREVDWEEDDNTKISFEQANEIQKILTTEISVFLLHRAVAACGSVDSMISIRRNLIEKYEETYEKYIEYNDFY